MFPDGVEFDANNLQPPVLTINAPIGLNFRDNPGNIIVQGNGNGARLSEELVNNQDGLQVNFDQTLALIGGNLTLDVATLITRGGTVELGSVEGNEQVRFTSPDGNLIPDYQPSAEEGRGGDINITAEALFGIEARELSDLTNDLNASSQFNQDGNINISILDVDLTQGVTELPQNLIEPETIVAQGCSYGRGSTQSNFTIQENSCKSFLWYDERFALLLD